MQQSEIWVEPYRMGARMGAYHISSTNTNNDIVWEVFAKCEGETDMLLCDSTCFYMCLHVIQHIWEISQIGNVGV